MTAQSAERTTPDKFSHLETDYAESDARINGDGTLSHSLKNKRTPQPVPVKNKTDTIAVERVIEKPVPVEVPKEVERELTRWERTKMDFGGLALGGVAAIICAAVAWLLYVKRRGK